LISSRSAAGRAALLTAATCEMLPGSASILYQLKEDGEGELFWVPVSASGDVASMVQALPARSTLFAPVIDASDPVVYSASAIAAEDYAHFHVSKSPRSIGYVPLITRNRLTGILELISFEDDLSLDDLNELLPLAHLTGASIAVYDEQHQERQDLLDSVHRFSQLYDLEKSLNATLELELVIDLVPQKVASMLPAQAIHLWMFDGADLRLMSRFGQDATVEVGAVQAPGQGYVADMAEEGEAILIIDPEDPRLAQRNAALEPGDEAAVRTAVLVPLLQDESEIGVIEAVNKSGNQPFDDDDLFFLSTMSETISSALKNASLMHAERKLQILELLVQVSAEITSTLRLDRLLQIIVNNPQSVLSYERCSVALDQRGRLQLKAVSGMDTIRTGDSTVELLRGLLHWLERTDASLLVRQHEDVPESEDPDVRNAVGAYFAESGCRAMFALPLSDDQGRVGLLLYESSNPDFLEVAQIEMIKVIAGQATVAMRNALLYREVPLISLMEPFLQGKQSFLRSDRKRRIAWLAAAAAAVLFLVLCPLPMRLGGVAVVAPRHIVVAATPLEGTVTAVYVNEGQHVTPGTVLGAMDNMAERRDLAAAATKYQSQMLAMQSDLVTQSPMAGRDRAQAEFLHAEMDRATQRIADSQIRSPIDGIVVTPGLQNVAGRHLDAGAPFAEVMDSASVYINVAIDEEDAPLLRPGQSVAIKLNSFPTQTFHGTVAIVSPQAEAREGARYLFARVLLPNTGTTLRDGMDGRAKVLVGTHPAGYVLLRRPALWLWKTLWNWIGW
jgi:multidrug resistance efflux pump/transcriptional regulator with GAF, ATPase, and Fis domain